MLESVSFTVNYNIGYQISSFKCDFSRLLVIALIVFAKLICISINFDFSTFVIPKMFAN